MRGYTTSCRLETTPVSLDSSSLLLYTEISSSARREKLFCSSQSGWVCRFYAKYFLPFMTNKNLKIAWLGITVSRAIYRPDENDTTPCNILPVMTEQWFLCLSSVLVEVLVKIFVVVEIAEHQSCVLGNNTGLPFQLINIF